MPFTGALGVPDASLDRFSLGIGIPAGGFTGGVSPIDPTGFTQADFGTPTLSVSSRIDFFGQGFTRRAFGTPSLEGGAQHLSVFIGGVDRKANLLAESATISKQIQTTGTCEVHFIVDVASGFRPGLGDSMVLQEFGRRRFAGFIDQIDETIFPGSQTYDFTCKALDWNGLTDRRIVVATYPPGQVLYILDKLMQNSVGGEGLIVTAGAVDPDLVTEDEFVFSYIKVREALNQLALALNAVWWIDDFKVLHFVRIADCLASTFHITDDGPQVDSIKVTRSLATYRNKQYIRSSSNLLSESITLTDSHVFSGANADIVCPTAYPLSSQPFSVKEDGIELVGSERLFELKLDGTTAYPSSGTGWYWFKGAFGVFFWPSSSLPPAATLLEVRYTGISTPSGNIVVYYDSAQIVAMALATGGSGLFEEVEDYSGAATYPEMMALAVGIVQATSPPPVEFSANTIEPIEGVGRKVSVILANYALADTYIIHRYTQRSEAVDLGKGTTFRTAVTLVSAKTQGNWVSWFERLISRQSTNATPAPTEKPTWTLALDAPGAPSSGLAVGSVGAIYPVQTGQGQILYVTAVFGEPPVGGDIVIDITLNGTSIFDGRKLRYAAGDTGVKEYGNLIHTPVNVVRGDQLQLSVASVGALVPGKNGTVVVLIAER